MIDGRHAAGTGSASGRAAGLDIAPGVTGSVVIAVHHQSLGLFRTAVTKGQCYVLTALQQASEEESADALEPVLHTTAATTLTPIDTPNVQSNNPGAALPARVLTVSQVLTGDTTRRPRDRPGPVDAPLPTKDDSNREADDSEDEDQTLSLDSACMDSSSEEDFAPVELPESPALRPESSALRESQIGDTMQMAPAADTATGDDGVDNAAPVAVQHSGHDVNGMDEEMESGGRLRCAAYVRSIGLQLPGVGSEDEDSWRSLLRWRCDRKECAHQCPFTTDFGATKVRCDRCGETRSVSLCEFSITLSDSSPDCDGKCNDEEAIASSEGLTVDVLPSAVSSLFCGLLTPELIASAHTTGSAEARGIRARVREAMWALSHSGSRLVFVLDDRSPSASTDSQGYGMEPGPGSKGGGLRFGVAGIDWSAILPLDYASCRCGDESNAAD